RLYRLFSIIEVGAARMGIGSSAMVAFKTALMLRGVIEANVVGRPQLRLNDEEVNQVRRALGEAGLS
ncbi:MAG: dihydrodipicolinate synthase family protein, partial [Chloroflexota bacterium]